MKQIHILLFIIVWPIPALAQGPVFPLHPSENGRYLVDDCNKPFFYQAETPWLIFINLNIKEMGELMDIRIRQGFTVIQTMALTTNTNVNGDKPFENNDFTKPNLDYFEHIRKGIQLAGEKRLYVGVALAWKGCCGGDWTDIILKNGPEKCRAYGRFLGRYFAGCNNLFWIQGGDNDPGPHTDCYRQIALGILEYMPSVLQTYHASSGHSSSDVMNYLDNSWMNFSWTYTYFHNKHNVWVYLAGLAELPEVYEMNYIEYRKYPIKPFVLGESQYEGEDSSSCKPFKPSEIVRRQAYWSVLSGSCGHAYGSWCYMVNKDWRKVERDQGACQMLYVRKFFESIAWYNLVPDINRTLLAEGAGRFGKTDFATSASLPDKSLIVVYLPPSGFEKRSLSIDVTGMKGEIQAKWFNPVSGVYTDAKFERSGNLLKTTSAGDNGDKSNDWILLIQSSFPQFKAQSPSKEVGGINELTPSKAIYFDWVNRNWYGSNEKKIEANLKFFKWLHDEYGMKLDIYLMDAGDIDQGPNCALSSGLPAYGSLETVHFKKRFPNGFDPLVKLANSFGCRMGIWLGPDGYGNTEGEALKRKEMLVRFCKDYHFALFKFDACCSDLSAANQKYYIETMEECRKYSPDLIVLNHRISLNDEARKQTTTFLWEGRETCVDVNITNDTVAPHHREGNLSRGLPPNLMRLTEDHGICLSTALEKWEDDLILQAFNRNLILSPEIYGNPFLLNDDQLSHLARIYNIHMLYNDILVKGMILPEDQYGKYAVSRGDSSTRLITLRNLTWQPVKVPVNLDASIGLFARGKVDVLQYHPTERFLGTFKPGTVVQVPIMPFSSCLIKISSQSNPELMLKGIDYEVNRYLPDLPVSITLFGRSGEKVNFSLSDYNRKYKKASLNWKDVSSILKGNQVSFTFPGRKQGFQYLRKLGCMQLADIPKDPLRYFESCFFAMDNNALEVRELLKSGNTMIPEVHICRNVFFNDTLFSELGIWDKYAFDSCLTTSFKVRRYEYLNMKENTGSFRLDLGEVESLDTIFFRGVPEDFNPGEIEVSNNFTTWHPAKSGISNSVLSITFPGGIPFKYLRMTKSPIKVAEIEGIAKGKMVSREKWKASNLYGWLDEKAAKLCWKYEGKLSGIGKEAKLSVNIPATCKEGTVFAMIVIDGKIIGANDRAPSFPYNNWEHFNIPEKNFTFYIPVTENMEGKLVQILVLSTDINLQDLKPEVWLTNADLYEKVKLIIE
jgi:hypothetical protein